MSGFGVVVVVALVFWCYRILPGGTGEMTKQETLEEFKSHRCNENQKNQKISKVDFIMRNNYFDGKIISAKEACDFAKFDHTKYPSDDELIAFYKNEENKELVEYIAKNILFAAKTKNWSIEAEFDTGIGEDRLVNIAALFRNMGYNVEINLFPKKYVLNISWPIFVQEKDLDRISNTPVYPSGYKFESAPRKYPW